MATSDFCKSLSYLAYAQGIARFSYPPFHSLLQSSVGLNNEAILGSHRQLVKEGALGFLVNTGN